jgi:hypothetical protein
VIYPDITLKVSPQPGLPGNSQTYIFTLPVFVGAETVNVPNGPKIAALTIKKSPGKGTVVVQDSSLNPSQIPVPSAQLTAEVNTASTAIVGRVDPKTLPVPAVAAPGGATTAAQVGSPANYPLLAVELTDPVSTTKSLLSFPQPGAKPPGSQTTTTLPVSADGTFSFPLSAPLTLQTQVRLIAVAPSGYSFPPATALNPNPVPIGEGLALETQWVVQAEIPLPEVNLAETLSAGQSVVTGSVAPDTLPVSPTPAAAPDPKAGTTASPGNLPLLALEIADPLTKLVTRTPLMVPGAPGATSTQIQIGSDGTFTLPLKTPLVSGQTIRIIAIPPQGYAFLPLPDATICNFGSGRGLRKAPSLVAANECVVLPDPDRPRLAVYTTLALSAPVVSSKLGLNATTINGLATPSTTGASGTTVLIGVERFPLGDPCRETKPKRILTSDEMEPTEVCPGTSEKPKLADLTIAASGSTSATTSQTVQTQANSSFSLTLAEPLAEEEKFRIVQILPPGTVFPDQKQALGRAFSQPITVPSVADWGRVHADFVAGLLTTNNNQIGSTDSGTFTQAHQFIALNVEKGWLLPGCYLQRNDECLRQTYLKHGKNHDQPIYKAEPQPWWERYHPGITTYFEGRLTAIPVTTVSSSSTTTGSTSTTSSASTLLTSNFLTNAQTARFGVGFYAPTLLQRWNWHGVPNALFVAPLAKVGFDSVTGATTVNVPAGTPGASATGTVTLEPLFNLWGYGGRVGHFNLSRSENKSPETESYIDIIYGPYSNLQSYICKVTPADKVTVATTSTTTPATTTTSTLFVGANGYPGVTGYPGSSCAADYPSYYAGTVPKGLTFSIPTNTATVTYTDTGILSYQPYDSRKRIYRLDIEGLLKIPMTPLYVGFNANLGQKTFYSIKLDHGYAAPDDLELFFGTKFDIGELLAKVGISPF